MSFVAPRVTPKGSTTWQEAAAAKGAYLSSLSDEQLAKVVSLVCSGASVGEAIRRLKDTP